MEGERLKAGTSSIPLPSASNSLYLIPYTLNLTPLVNASLRFALCAMPYARPPNLATFLSVLSIRNPKSEICNPHSNNPQPATRLL
jgi:hypothetical protein